MIYSPGTHLIATLQTDSSKSLKTFEKYRVLLNGLIEKHHLQKLGEVYHNFQPAGFTSVVCLSESHISIHTWPEFGKINLDIYLSNFQRNNDGTVRDIFQQTVDFFEATIESKNEILR